MTKSIISTKTEGLHQWFELSRSQDNIFRHLNWLLIVFGTGWRRNCFVWNWTRHYFVVDDWIKNDFLGLRSRLQMGSLKTSGMSGNISIDRSIRQGLIELRPILISTLHRAKTFQPFSKVGWFSWIIRYIMFEIE